MESLICAVYVYDGKYYVGSCHGDCYDKCLADNPDGIHGTVNRGYFTESGKYVEAETAESKCYRDSYAYAEYLGTINLTKGQKFADEYNKSKTSPPPPPKKTEFRNTVELLNAIDREKIDKWGKYDK